MAFPSLTKTWHSEPYNAISPSRPELSVAGKTVVITGAGGATGAATTLAFAQAGCTKLALLSRRTGPLVETREKVLKAAPKAQVLEVSTDIADGNSVRQAFEKVRDALGPIDIFVSNAGYLPKFEGITDTDPEEWWKGFEINTKGVFNIARALLRNGIASDNCIVVDVSTCVVHMPGMANGSGYIGSKAAATKIWEIVAKEHPQKLEVVSVHPGVVYSEINIKSGITPADDANLPGQFILWICSPEAAWLRTPGKYAWCNWDVPELLSMKDKLDKPDQLVITLQGWPFGQDSDGGDTALEH